MAPRTRKPVEIEQPCVIPSPFGSSSDASSSEPSSPKLDCFSPIASSGLEANLPAAELFAVVAPPSLSQARDPFDGPIVPLLLGAMAIAGVAGAVIDGVGMAARAVRRV
jgi:hypothetical protein